MPDTEPTALEVLETQDTPSTTLLPEKSTGDVPERTRKQENREALLKLFVESGDMDQKTADAIDKSKSDKEKPDVRLNKAGRKIGKDGTFIPKAEESQPETPLPPPDVPDVPQAIPQVASEFVLPNADEFAKLAAAIQRYNGTKADQELLTNGDVDQIEYARGLLKIQTDIDNDQTKSKVEREELDSLRAQVTELTVQKASVEPLTADATNPSEFDLAEATKPLSDYLEQMVGGEVAEPVTKAFKNILDHVDKDRETTAETIRALHETIVNLQEHHKSLNFHVFDAHFQNACLTLAQEYPQLSDDKLRTAVRERALEIGGDKKYSDKDVLFVVREAAKIEVAPIIAKENATYQAKHRAARAEGVADLTPGVLPPSSATPSRRDLATKSLSHMDPDSPQYDPKKAKAIANQMAAMIRS